MIKISIEKACANLEYHLMLNSAKFVHSVGAANGKIIVTLFEKCLLPDFYNGFPIESVILTEKNVKIL